MCQALGERKVSQIAHYFRVSVRKDFSLKCPIMDRCPYNLAAVAFSELRSSSFAVSPKTGQNLQQKDCVRTGLCRHRDQLFSVKEDRQAVGIQAQISTL